MESVHISEARKVFTGKKQNRYRGLCSLSSSRFDTAIRKGKGRAIAKALKPLGYGKAVGGECPRPESRARLDGYASVLMREYASSSLPRLKKGWL
jgi:hypothetical protein